MWGSHYEMLALGSCQTVPIHPIGSAWMPTAIKVCSHSHRQQVKQQMWSSFSTASRCGSTAPSCRVQSSRQCLPEMYYVHYPHMSAIAATPKASEPVLFKPTGFVHDRIPDSSYLETRMDTRRPAIACTRCTQNVLRQSRSPTGRPSFRPVSARFARNFLRLFHPLLAAFVTRSTSSSMLHLADISGLHPIFAHSKCATSA